MTNILKFLGLVRRSPLPSLANGTAVETARSWQEDYLLGHSDTDARWYYERCRWRAQD
jgi:hypothetical protein